MKRTLLVCSGVVLCAFIIAGFLLNTLSSAENELASLNTRYEEMLKLKDEFLSLKQKVQRLEGKKHLIKVHGIMHAVDEVFEPLGLKDKIKSVKLLDEKPSETQPEERAELNIQSISMNEMVNILYSIENAPMLLVIKKINIKTSFENPELLNITMTLSLVKAG